MVLAGDPTSGGLVLSEPGSVPRVLGDVDVVLPLLHGPFGEDGTLQGLLELAGVPYVGSGVLSSAAAMDKSVMKVLLAAAGLPVGAVRGGPGPRLAVGGDGRADPGRARAAGVRQAGTGRARAWASAGSPRGTTSPTPSRRPARTTPRSSSSRAWSGARSSAACWSPRTVPGWSRASAGRSRVLGGHDFYDFEAKYIEVDDVTRLDVPADLPQDVAERVRAMAQVAFRALECEGFARVDFFVDADGGITVNELNTIPGFTPVSMFPLLWDASGVPYPQLVDRLLRSALRKRRGLR